MGDERENEQKSRMRIMALLDKDSFHEVNAQSDSEGHYNTNGSITGVGKIGGQTVCVYSQDINNFHGAIGVEHGRKIIKLQRLALRKRCPIIGINDSGEARIQEGVCALHECGKILYNNTRMHEYNGVQSLNYYVGTKRESLNASIHNACPIREKLFHRLIGLI